MLGKNSRQRNRQIIAKRHIAISIVPKTIEEHLAFSAILAEQDLGVFEGGSHQWRISMPLEDSLDRLKHPVLLQHLLGQVIPEPFQALHLHRSSVL